MVGVTVVIIAQNEEPNIAQCVQSVIGWADSVFVVDSFSVDETPELARAHGAEVVQHEFVDWASQRNWALENLPLDGEWVFFLDADESVTKPFKRSLEKTLRDASDDLCGVYVRFAFYFLGRELRHAYEAPPVMRIVRRGRARWMGEGAREYCRLKGRTIVIEERLVHRDRKGLHEWIKKQNRNATREARIELVAQREKEVPGEGSDAITERPFRTWLRQEVYPHLPQWLRPFVHFGYRYLLRGGLLDGYPGFVFCFLHAFWYPMLIDAKIYEAHNLERSLNTRGNRECIR